MTESLVSEKNQDSAQAEWKRTLHDIHPKTGPNM